MDLFASNGPLHGLRGKGRTNVVDYRAPLLSPVTVLVMLLHAIGFRWYGATKRLPNGNTGTTCFLDTTIHYGDGGTQRRIAWSFLAGQLCELGGDPVTIVQVCHFFDASRNAPQTPIPRGAEAVLRAIRTADPAIWTGEKLFNDRGRLLIAAAANCTHREGRLLLADVVEFYRGYIWKLATPVGHPPHHLYGYPLDRHLRYHKGKRTGDVRNSICKEERMEELRMFGLR